MPCPAVVHVIFSVLCVIVILDKALSGGYCGGVPPLPIPNREVKPACADGTAMQCGRVGGRLFFRSPGHVMVSGGTFFVSPRHAFRRWYNNSPVLALNGV